MSHSYHVNGDSTMECQKWCAGDLCMQVKYGGEQMWQWTDPDPDLLFQATKCEKDLMRPLYDRYRSIKRILAKPHSVGDQFQCSHSKYSTNCGYNLSAHSAPVLWLVWACVLGFFEWIQYFSKTDHVEKQILKSGLPVGVVLKKNIVPFLGHGQ